jgi:anaerobic glycerol-3-phosphate dehydrogenase
VRKVDLLVVGAGIAGTAAAYFAAKGGASVVLVSEGTGASALYSGALDWNFWERGGKPPDDPALPEFASALGCWTLSAAECRLATSSGTVRGARGHDGALLDLEQLRGGAIAVADVERDDFRAELVARSLSASNWARQTGTRFEAVAVRGIAYGYERRLCAYDFAELLDADERRAWFVERLREAAGACDGWLVGPWLGVDVETTQRIRQDLGKPIGEVASLPGGPAGARFEIARDRLLERVRVTRTVGRVTRVAHVGSAWRATVRGSALAELGLEASAVVLAIGGLVGGGVEYRGQSTDGAGFSLSLDAPLRLELDGEDATIFSTLRGLDLTTAGFDALERVGIAFDGPENGRSGILVAGDCVAAEPRTALRAALGGIRAARLTMAPQSR